ncbi:diguanylate cyclase (GGDEF)-like protein [Parasphingopyxis lamellibrachiae]|uniref:Diguanylate cyclase (GGDEF)-like protein n=1 Tax=Parasphingopyxis lamellibrachiae TaxID=680125 RepID=A0A3D9FCW7_9SPHN|nr:diguanylate cyclase (GGDEF)-like protein [Parasphingopyxis lamellibrachiae]
MWIGTLHSGRCALEYPKIAVHRSFLGPIVISTFASSTGNPLFLLSFRQRNELATVVERAGWAPIAARRMDKAERRFILSGARIAVVDSRGAFDDGLAAIRILADPVEANAAALLVLVSKTDVARIDQVLAAGATHYLASPFGDQELIQTLRFVDRYTVRVGGRYQHAAARVAPETVRQTWKLDRGAGQVALNPSLTALLDVSLVEEGSILWPDFLQLLGEKAGEEAGRALDKLTGNGQPTAFAHDLPGASHERMVHHLTLDEDGKTVRAWVELPDEETDHRNISESDYLTGVGDVHSAHQWIDTQLGAERGDGPKLALLLISLHRFERINQAYGSATGDAVLQGMARRIERLIFAMPMRAKLVARLAGAEFAIGLAPSVSLEEAEFAARQLVGVLEKPFITDDQVIRLKTRCGIVTSEDGDENAAAVMRRASVALAEARDGETHPIRVFGKDEEGQAERDSQLEIDLRHALDRDEIEILYQPQVSITSGKIVGVEALARWQHPVFGELGAIALFAAAERSDYLIELSQHVQKKAVETAMGWPSALAGLRLSVNVTAADMAEEDFVDRFSEMVDDAGFDHATLTVEVTESGLIEDLGIAAECLAELRASKFRVAIDDFGTGYSSLAYLKTLPLDYLKIDQRLSQDITGSARDRIVVTGVIEMARSLGLSVIAEGVETEEQLSLLAEQGCELYQGYLCAPPVDIPALEALVAGHN